ncbi:PREDICTED: lysosome membrane protein 2-like [Dinoponera quadriceps]|uniref:Lysosome membrane protein 2-like n=1 Tax=Dinoponera quadriceps TaxID=609295 RepID=A0A6P3XMD6_DINQU|nr:PREDICTED: lysosome membrane protein 2-like [Dinoponera quadriceps]
MTIPVTETALDLEKTAMARCARRSPFRSWPAWLYFGVFLVSFGVFYIFWCTNNLHDYVQSQLLLRNGTEAMFMWQHPPVDVKTKIYVFNYTNVDDFLHYRADKLHVEEVGPYIYLQKKKRVNVTAGKNNDTLVFQEEKFYEWVGGRSEDDVIVAPNVPLLSSVAFVQDWNFAAHVGLTMMSTSLKKRPFIHERAGGFIWGYDDNFFNMVKPFVQQITSVEKFGILAMTNGTDKSRITINTGTRDITKLGMIEQLDGMSSSYIWGDKRCDKIEGTDGTIFPPNLLENNDTVYIYFKDMCRTVPFKFDGHVTKHSVPTLRYKPSRDMFAYTHEKNKCFCRQKGFSRVCPHNGTFDLSACIKLPMVASFPHFLDADQSLTKYIDGLHPREEDHVTFLDVYPNIAAPIAGWTRFQVNVKVRKVRTVPLLGRLPDGLILPILWLETGIDEADLPQNIMSLLYMLNVTLRIVEVVLQWSSLVGMILSMGALLVCFKKHRMEHPDVGLQMSSVDQNKLLEMS